MKSLLLAPYAGGDSLDREGKIFKERVFPAPALGVHHIASYLKEHGFHCDVLDPNIQYDRIRPLLEQERYDLVGFSMNHQTLEHDLGIVHLVKKHLPKALLVAGGIEATFNYQQIFRYGPLDLVVLGEGEKPLLDICSGKDWQEIPGLYLREGERIVFTGHRPALNKEEFSHIVLNLDFKNIPYHLYWQFLEARYDGCLSPKQLQEIRTIRLYTTNYCPYECAFCSATHFRSFVEGKKAKVVSLDPAGIVRILKRALECYPLTETVFFSDDDFVLDPNRTKGICQEIIRAKEEGSLPAKLSFIANTRLNNLTAEIISLMEKAGWRIILCGVESFSPKLLREYNKKFDLDMVHENIDLLLQSTISPYLTIILFSPESTIDDVILTVKQSIKYALAGAGLGIYTYVIPLPGCQMLQRKGVEIEYHKVPIPGTNLMLDKISRIMPKDKQVRSLLYAIDYNLESVQEELAHRYKIVHFSSRIYSLVFLYIICQNLGLKEQLKAVENLLAQAGA
jgi:radical SAM superfamily enzyme YgiQ (UPF0313 family)